MKRRLMWIGCLGLVTVVAADPARDVQVAAAAARSARSKALREATSRTVAAKSAKIEMMTLLLAEMASDASAQLELATKLSEAEADKRAKARQSALSGLAASFQVKGSPALMAMGATPESVYTPKTIRDLAMDLVEGLDKEGNHKQGFAFEISPFREGIKKNTKDFATLGFGQKALFNTAFSLGFVKGSPAADKSSRLGFGIRWNPLDQPQGDAEAKAKEVRTGEKGKELETVALHKEAQLAEELVLLSLIRHADQLAEGSSLKKMVQAEGFKTLGRQGVVSEELIQKGFEEGAKAEVEAAESESKTKQRLEVSFGSSLIDEAGGGKFNAGGSTFLFSYALPFDDKNTTGLFVGYRQSWKLRVADTKAASGFDDEDSRTLGLGLVYMVTDFSVEFKLEGTQFRRSAGWDKKLDGVLNLGYKVTDDQWITASLTSKIAGGGDNKLKIAMTFALGKKETPKDNEGADKKAEKKGG